MEDLINLQKAIQARNGFNFFKWRAKNFSILKKCILFDYVFNETLFFNVFSGFKIKYFIVVGTTNEQNYTILALRFKRGKSTQILAKYESVQHDSLVSQIETMISRLSQQQETIQWKQSPKIRKAREDDRLPCG